MFHIFNKDKSSDFHPCLFNGTVTVAQSAGAPVFQAHIYLEYYIYIVTDKDRRKIEIDITGALSRRLYQLENAVVKGINKRSPCGYLVYWEGFSDSGQIFDREKEIRRLSKKKIRELINSKNPEWKFLNEEIHQAYLLLPTL